MAISLKHFTYSEWAIQRVDVLLFFKFSKLKLQIWTTAIPKTPVKIFWLICHYVGLLHFIAYADMIVALVL